MSIVGSDELLKFPDEGAVRLNDEEVRRAVYQAHGGMDFWRQQPVSFDEMYLDHVVPRSENGPDNLFNVVPTTQRMNAVKGEKSDLVALIPVLSILRIHYGWRALKLLGYKRPTPVWWKPDPDSLRPEALHPGELATDIDRFLEEHRLIFATRFEVSRTVCWLSIARELDDCGVDGAAGRHRYQTNAVRSAWRRVVNRERWPA